MENRLGPPIIDGCTPRATSMSSHLQDESSPSSSKSPELSLDGELLRDPVAGAEHEWVEGDGLGGFASGTVNLCPTRRYHGLLVGPTAQHVERHVFLSRFDETLHAGGRARPLNVARYGEDVIVPDEPVALSRFELAPWPTWEYEIARVRVRREVLSLRGRSAVLVRWSLVEVGHEAAMEDPLELELRPLLPYRAADALTMRNEVLDGSIRVALNGFSCQPYASLPRLHLAGSPAPSRVHSDGVWYEGIWYERDRERGYDFQESQFSPATLRFPLRSEQAVVVAVSTNELVADPEREWERESTARARGAGAFLSGVRGACEAGADAFLYSTPTPGGGSRTGVIAGFPWFLEWGRDTFLSLPGLTLARGRVDQCAEALSGALEYLDGGLIPNIFGRDKASSHYGSVDAALWLARCVRLFERGGGTRRFVIENYRSSLVNIVDAYLAGSELGIQVDDSGLLRAGDESTNATWMDARTEKGPVTPRAGFAVEIQALWIHLLAHLEDLFRDSGLRREKRRFQEAHRKARASFLERFWIEEKGYLADVWTECEGPDVRVRPNMVLAAAFEFTPLSKSQRMSVVALATQELWTPRGLRTLAPSAPEYRGVYGGGVRERDEAYHQGTVWPWLLGFYIEASLRAGRTSAREIRKLRACWDGFQEELAMRGIGHLSEVFSGDPPHAGGGTIAQAWNTAECLRSFAMLDSYSEGRAGSR